MATREIAPIQAELFRLIRLNDCGVPITGAGNQIVSDGFVQVEVTQQYEDGTDYAQRNGKGEYCINKTGPDQFRRVDLTIQFCGVCPDIVNLITGSDLVVTGAPVTGSGFWVTEGSVTDRFSLEVWQASGADECVGGIEDHAYWAFPNLGGGRFNDFTILDGVLEWSLSAKSQRASTSWFTPGTDWISAVPPDAHFGFNIASLPLPEDTGCAAQLLPAS